MMRFKTNPVALEDLLKDCGSGRIQLPDFQRNWVWGEDRIKGLLASVSQAFPIGALMTLELKQGAGVSFAKRPIQGANQKSDSKTADQLLLDGQQRMTSLYQTCVRNDIVKTITSRNKFVERWFYFDIEGALRSDIDREDAIFATPKDKIIKTNFDKDYALALSTPEGEYKSLSFPMHKVFEWDSWQSGFDDYWLDLGDRSKREIFKNFKNKILQNFKSYSVPVIALGEDTTHEAVCLVFEKVNTGGKALDAFELVTAMYAAQGFRLRADWLGENGQSGLQERLQFFGHSAGQKFGLLEKLQNTDVLQTIALLHTRSVREMAANNGVKEGDLPGIRATRQSLLELPLEAYRQFRPSVEEAFKTAAKFLRQEGIYRVLDLPYHSQIVPLAAILAVIGSKWEHAENKVKLARWFWCGIFGELYGSGAEARFARDIAEFPAWLEGGDIPSTVRDGAFRKERLRSMRSRQSAAYKGVHALLLKRGAKDFRSGAPYDAALFFGEAVDIHHIFPEDWCKSRSIDVRIYDTIINKTPLSYRTNRKIGGIAPSKYIDRLERGIGDDPKLDRVALDEHLVSHCIDPSLLRADDFESFMENREKQLLKLIGDVTGHLLIQSVEEGEDIPEEIARDHDLAAA